MANKLRALLSAGILCAVLAALAASALMQPDAPALWLELLHLHDRVVLYAGEDRLGDVYVTDERLLPCMTDYSEEQLSSTAEAINAFAADCPSSVYLLAVPTAAGIYADTLPDTAPKLNEHAMLHSLHEQLSGGAVWIEAESWLSAAREQDIYFRTDPCWTGYGAYCVYKTAIRKLGFTAYGYDSFVITHFSDSYYGELAQQIRYTDVQPDLIDLYTLLSDAPNVQAAALRSGGTVPLESACWQTARAMQSGDPTDVCLTAGEPVVRAVTDRAGGRRLLLLTDDFGGAMMPFLLLHYSEVTAVNLPLAQETDWRTAAGSGYDQVLILLGADSLRKGIAEMLRPA